MEPGGEERRGEDERRGEGEGGRPDFQGLKGQGKREEEMGRGGGGEGRCVRGRDAGQSEGRGRAQRERGCRGQAGWGLGERAGSPPPHPALSPPEQARGHEGEWEEAS